MTDQELYNEEYRQKLIEFNNKLTSLEDTFKSKIDELRKDLQPKENVEVTGQVTVNTEKEVAISNLEGLQEQIKELGDTISKSIEKHAVEPVNEVTVKNIEQAINKEVTITNISDIQRYFSDLAKVIVENQPIVEKQVVEFPTSASKPISVRLSDGKSFYNAITAFTNALSIPLLEENGVKLVATGSIEHTIRLDDTTTANTTYIGKAPIGSETSSAVWQIKKLDTSSGLIKTWADGNASFDNVWNDRVSLTYN